ncbi:MAG TPA: hypothetical protein VF508_14915, partial [Pyrinomonadaceae bacterium]
MKITNLHRHRKAGRLYAPSLVLMLLALCGAAGAQTTDSSDSYTIQPYPQPVETIDVGPSCNRVITADVVALDQPIVYNRLGAMNPGGMMFALRNDVEAIDTGSGLVAGNVKLKDYKRPRPLTLRMNV